MTKDNYRKIEAYGVLFIAVSALVVSIWQVNLTRQHNRLTVKPYLDVDFVADDTGAHISIKNKGEGAAIIRSFALEWEGRQFDDWTKLFQSVQDDLSSDMSRTFEMGDIIGSKEELVLTSLPGGAKQRINVKVTVGYTSIYDEEFVFETTIGWGGTSRLTVEGSN